MRIQPSRPTRYVTDPFSDLLPRQSFRDANRNERVAQAMPAAHQLEFGSTDHLIQKPPCPFCDASLAWSRPTPKDWIATPVPLDNLAMVPSQPGLTLGVKLVLNPSVVVASVDLAEHRE